MSMNRRSVVKAIATGGALIGASVLMPRIAMAAWTTKAFEAEDQATAMNELLGGTPEESAEVTLKAPDIAENGAVVPVTVRSSLADIESMSIFVKDNPTPLVAEFMIPAGTKADVSTRLRMGKTSQVTAVVKAGGKLYSASKEVKVTIGGCGG
ncbi:thiosulfate oxidation carrier protein SoxY [Neptuniibacter caesariensis]|uniref:Transmembrane proetin, twin-arginine translocation pathway signal n=1 Tax=Neptuniibacter caesariensis TaxID=207954 RepID=A0A7U8C6B3_NEPCE|nr:thiosulfate oxidation carrier protein SoxY [Neptuniibacter caesariensis]EAR60696.1 transmembrane proetin, twin-arginine translocation pathway signal [Neptuniibacter caesariensis]